MARHKHRAVTLLEPDTAASASFPTFSAGSVFLQLVIVLADGGIK